jgi:NDP-sugar pyrophosphorylase family protein
MRVPNTALVLAAGVGTRLQPLTFVRAKPAIPVAGEPMIRRILRGLAAQGVSDVVINLHHLPATLTSVVGDGSDLGVRVRYSWERVVLGSAGGPRRALDILESDCFFIVNGDTLTDVNLGALAAAHERANALVTLALTGNSETARYGGVVLDAERRVLKFVPRGPSAGGSFHFVGIQLARADAFRHLPPNRPVNSIGEVYDEIITRQAGAIRGFVSDCAFWDVGTVHDYVSTNAAFSPGTSAAPRSSVHVDPAAQVTNSILWNDIDVEAGARLDRCIVTDGVRIPSGATHTGVIVRAGAAGTLIVDPIGEAHV